MKLGERAADRMKAALSTWTALLGTLVFVLTWMATDGLGLDRPPYIGLNLVLSCFAALQCFVLLIAAKRSDHDRDVQLRQDSEHLQADLTADQDTNALVREIKELLLKQQARA